MKSIKDYISKVIFIMPQGHTKSFLLIIFLMILNTIFEILGIGLIIPLLSLFFEDTNSQFVENFLLLSNFSNESKILIILLLLLVVFIIKNTLLLIFHKKKINFSQDLARLMTNKLYVKYIKKNYIYYTFKNSSELIRNISGEANLFALGIVFSLISIIIDSLIFFAILVFLFIYNFQASLIAIITILSFGLIIFIFQQKKLKLWGELRMTHSNAIIKLIQETLLKF